MDAQSDGEEMFDNKLINEGDKDQPCIYWIPFIVVMHSQDKDYGKT